MKITLGLFLLLTFTPGFLSAQKTDIRPLVEHHYANNDGVKIHYVTMGDGPLVLFVHGFPDFWYSWRDQMMALSKDYKVAAVDLRGYNLSDHPKGVQQYQFEFLVKDLAAVIKDLGKEKVFVIAHDWGAAISWRLAALHPELVDKYVALNIPHPKAGDKVVPIPIEDRKPSYADTFVSDAFKEKLTEQWFSGWVKDPKAKEIYKEAFRKSDKTAMINYYRANFPTLENLKKESFTNRNRDLPNLKMPVLIIHGKKDAYSPTKGHNNTWDFVDNELSIEVLPNAGHFVQQDESEKVTALIKAFLLKNQFKQKTKTNKQFSIDRFSQNLKATLADSSTGWAYQIWKGAKRLKSDAGGFRIAAVDNKKEHSNVPFDTEHRMHIASISKAITAIAIARTLQENELNWNEKIKYHLPSTWIVHPSFEQTTFGQLLEMRSGLKAQNDAITSNDQNLKNLVEKGVNPKDIGQYNYQNVSYGLLRILIAQLNQAKVFETQESKNQENSLAQIYIDYVNENILKLAGIPFASCQETSASPTLMYPFPYHGESGLITGFSSLENPTGDLTNYAGGLGWYLSVNDLGKLFTTFFNSKNILSKEAYDSLLNQRFPFYQSKKHWGKYLAGMGMWVFSKPNAGYNCGLNTLFVLFPDNTLVIAFVNSKGKGIRNLRARCILAYSNSLE